VVSDGKRIFISPLAKKIAEEKGINISQVKGSGENGRIVKSDIENFTQSNTSCKPQHNKLQSAPAIKKLQVLQL
jgi:pyruvate dehydrogenase E2 component (dihydrolipoamide acetyltransferase)